MKNMEPLQNHMDVQKKNIHRTNVLHISPELSQQSPSSTGNLNEPSSVSVPATPVTALQSPHYEISMPFPHTHSPHSHYGSHSHLHSHGSADETMFKDKPVRSSLLRTLKSLLNFPILKPLMTNLRSSISKDTQIRRIAAFLLINVICMLVEFIYGYVSNSLGLMGDAVHMLTDSSAIFLNLLVSAFLVSSSTTANNQKGTDRRFPYGYGRIEFLLAFCNCLVLGGVGLWVYFEAFGRMWSVMFHGIDGDLVEGEQLLSVSIMGLIVNLIGIFAFDHSHLHSHHGHSHGHDCSHDHHGHSHGKGGNAVVEAMYLHILADALGSVGVIISSLLIRYFNMQLADPICSIFIATLIIWSVYPLLKRSSYALLQATPPDVEERLSSIVHSIQTCSPGVLTVRELYFWMQSSDEVVGTVKVLMDANLSGDDQTAKGRIYTAITSIVPQCRWLTIQIDK